jgi:hypothetical protein
VARADSTIRVNIIGDAKSLTKAADKAEGSVKGMNSQLMKVGGIIAGSFVAKELVDFGATAVQEADRVSDAAGRIESQLGALAGPLTDAADGFAKVGASEGDMLILEAKLIDVGTALQITDQHLASVADDAALTAAALSLITDTDADTWMDLITKAAGGSEKALKALGISVTDTEVVTRALADTGKDNAEALTEGELAAARLDLVLEKLNPRIQETITGTGDLEQKQAELEARVETLQGKIGEKLTPVLEDMLDFVLRGIDGWEMLGGALEGAKVDVMALITPVKLLIAPFLVLNDVIAESIRLLGQFFATAGSPTKFGGVAGPRAPGIGGSVNTTVNVQGGSPEAIEQAVRKAVLTVGRRG